MQKLVEYARPKEKFLISVSGCHSRLHTFFVPAIEFSPSSTYEIALIGLEAYYSFPNITKSNNHIKLSFDQGKKWNDFLIPIGCYEVETIDDILQEFVMKVTGDKKWGKKIRLSPNPNTLRCVLTIFDRDLWIDFNVDATIASVLGFAKRIYKIGQHEGEDIVKIMSVNSILVHCDVIESSVLNGHRAPIIYSFFPDVEPGEKIALSPQHLIYLPISRSLITDMRCWLTDQDGQDLNLRGETVTLTFHIRAC